MEEGNLLSVRRKTKVYESFYDREQLTEFINSPYGFDRNPCDPGGSAVNASPQFGSYEPNCGLCYIWF